MVVAFFDSQGLICTNYVPWGTWVIAKYIMDALGRFLKVFKQKRREMVARRSTRTMLQCTPPQW
jgi:hypothetical protein